MLSASEPMVQTVTGLVPANELGHTQCHEHIYLRKGPSWFVNPALCMDDFDKSKRELEDYQKAGGATIVDAQPAYFGRDAGALQRLSEQSGVKIVAVTGFHKLQFLESGAPLLDLDGAGLTDLFASEITDGMVSDSGARAAAKAGMAKVAFDVDALNSSQYGRMFHAVAKAAAMTGAPVMVHTEKGNDLLALVKLFETEGVDPSRVTICHLDRTNLDPDYHRQVLHAGCTLCYDSVHRLKYVSDAQELQLIASMLESGYEDRLVLSLDTTNERLRAYNAKDMGLDYILKSFIPMLRDYGINSAQIDKMCRQNAARALAMLPIQ